MLSIADNKSQIEPKQVYLCSPLVPVWPSGDATSSPGFTSFTSFAKSFHMLTESPKSRAPLFCTSGCGGFGCVTLSTIPLQNEGSAEAEGLSRRPCGTPSVLFFHHENVSCPPSGFDVFQLLQACSVGASPNPDPQSPLSSPDDVAEVPATSCAVPRHMSTSILGSLCSRFSRLLCHALCAVLQLLQALASSTGSWDLVCACSAELLPGSADRV
mmetsp:Transcript_10812/g.45040  ORF Transcript_10812/g.45040 Transcript_10812/m.45040 type:complete len:214 (-) Transcript_10812:333-974(-)